MAEANTDRFPNSDLSGIALPFDLGNPYGTFNVTTSGAASALKTLPADTEVISIKSSVDAVMAFGAAPTPSVADDVFTENQVYLPAQQFVHLRVPSNKFKAMNFSGAGTLRIQVWKAWKATGPAALQNVL